MATVDNLRAEQFFINAKWPTGVICAYCNSDSIRDLRYIPGVTEFKTYKSSFMCQSCHRQFGVKRGTIMEDLRSYSHSDWYNFFKVYFIGGPNMVSEIKAIAIGSNRRISIDPEAIIGKITNYLMTGDAFVNNLSKIAKNVWENDLLPEARPLNFEQEPQPVQIKEEAVVEEVVEEVTSHKAYTILDIENLTSELQVRRKQLFDELKRVDERIDAYKVVLEDLKSSRVGDKK